MQIEYLSPDHALITDAGVSVDAYCLELGSANLIFVKTSSGIVGCGFFDLATFENFGIPAAKVTGISTIEDLLKVALCGVVGGYSETISCSSSPSGASV